MKKTKKSSMIKSSDVGRRAALSDLTERVSEVGIRRTNYQVDSQKEQKPSSSTKQTNPTF